MRNLFIIILLVCNSMAVAQERVIIGNFYQFGTVPQTFDANNNGKRLNANSLIINLATMNEHKFFRADLTWVVKRLIEGNDTVQRDSNIVKGLDLPVFAFSMGWNIIGSEGFCLGVGMNLDTRNYFANSNNMFGAMINAFQTGVIVATKIRLHDKVTYTGFYGYDFMFTGKNVDVDGRKNIYLSNNISYKVYRSLAINLQPDISFKTFKDNGKNKVSNFSSRSIKLGLALLID